MSLEWLLPILVRKRPDGSFYYSNEDFAAFVPAMLISFGFDPRELTPALAAVIDDFASNAGVQPGMSREEAMAAMQDHLRRHPLNAELVFEFKRGLREERGSESCEDVGRRFTRLVTGSELAARLERRSPPPGSVRGGPLARIDLSNRPLP